MYEYILGTVVDIYDDCLILENNGIGYKIYITSNAISKLKLKDYVKVYTYYNVREDGVFLFGFLSIEEKEMFELLLLVSKVGPKTALGILSALSYNDIKLAILNNNVELLCTAPGVGKKTASRIILELKDKIDDHIVVEDELFSADNNSLNEAISALLGLGYTKKEIDSVMLKIETKDLTTEEIIKIALRELCK